MTVAKFNDLASSSDLGTTETEQLYAGERAPVTTFGTLLTGVNYAKYTVLGKFTSGANIGKLTTLTPAATDGTQFAVAILAQPLNTISPAGDRRAPIFEGGVFNHQVLVWPAAIDTLLERVAAFAGTDITVQQLYG
jgi:hypothetical protein